jgi:hypothetical protein
VKLYETITAENWVKGSYTSRESHCLVGHLNARRIYMIEDFTRLVDAIRLLFPERLMKAMPSSMLLAEIFNDHPDTTVEDVIRVCKVADV